MIYYATATRGMGVHGEGLITEPKELPPAYTRAVAAVKSGEPSVVDVVTDPR
jgi:thiamine pyrophosphate-dependent acetolactate synthase large subunit-like protein